MRRTLLHPIWTRMNQMRRLALPVDERRAEAYAKLNELGHANAREERMPLWTRKDIRSAINLLAGDIPASELREIRRLFHFHLKWNREF